MAMNSFRLDAIELQVQMVGLGVIPAGPGMVSSVENVRLTLDQLSEAEKRMVKRRYRKLWRKACQYMAAHDPDRNWVRLCGFGADPNQIHAGHRHYRSAAVVEFLRKTS